MNFEYTVDLPFIFVKHIVVHVGMEHNNVMQCNIYYILCYMIS